MQEKLHHTTQGSIHYWTDACAPGPMTLVLLPGLTADHRLFDRPIDAFRGRWRLLAWDPPGHGASRPFALTFGLADKARWLHAILEQEGVSRFCLVGQSMGGYVAQSFLQQFPGQAAGFISIDSAPLGRRYTRPPSSGCCAGANRSTACTPGRRCARRGPAAGPGAFTARP